MCFIYTYLLTSIISTFGPETASLRAKLHQWFEFVRKELISIRLPLRSPLPSRDRPSIKPNSSSKTSPPPHRPPIQRLLAPRRLGFMSWMSSVSFTQPFAVSKKNKKIKYTASPPPFPPSSSLPPRPRRVEQKVVVISGPLRHNDRSCAAPTECNVLFWKEYGHGHMHGHVHGEAATRPSPPAEGT